MDRFAILDIGTNSAHLVIAEVGQDSRFSVIDKHKVILRLGDELDLCTKLMSEAGCKKVINVVKQTLEIVSNYQAHLRVIATHALRKSKNRGELLSRVLSETGVKIELIDGVEEARLISLGVQTAFPLKNKKILVVDIGGGPQSLPAAKMAVLPTPALFSWAPSF